MKAAIDAGLGYAKKPGEGGDDEAAKAAAKKKAEEEAAAAAAAGKETETHYANGKPKKNEKGEDLDDKGQVKAAAAPKAKTSTELALTKEQLAVLKPEARARFQEVISTLKAHEGTIAKQTETIKNLGEARDAILGVMEETHTSQDQLAAYLEFNALLQSKDPKDLESALQMVEDQRTALYQALGREPEGGGVDLLADFPDLKEQVENEDITRKAALEIAKGRREEARRQAEARQQQDQQRTQQQTEAERKKAGEKALGEIQSWTAGLEKSDLDYKAKEDRLLPQVQGVLKEYPPHLWLPTLKRMYEGIVIQKPATTGDRQQRPLRPSGARPGAPAPASMQEAIDQGLGYASSKG